MLLKFFSHLYNFDLSIYDITAKEVLDTDKKVAALEMSNFEDEHKPRDEEEDEDDDNEEEE